MPASATLITDVNAMLTAGQSVATAAKSTAAAGPIEDVLGNIALYKLRLQECVVLLGEIKKGLDSGDGNLTYVNNALLTLV